MKGAANPEIDKLSYSKRIKKIENLDLTIKLLNCIEKRSAKGPNGIYYAAGIKGLMYYLYPESVIEESEKEGVFKTLGPVRKIRNEEIRKACRKGSPYATTAHGCEVNIKQLRIMRNQKQKELRTA